jgi:hypothetical protein
MTEFQQQIFDVNVEMRPPFAALLFAVVVLCCGIAQAADDAERGTVAASMVSLIADPSSFESRRISTNGYLAVIASTPFLFLSHEHARMDDTASGFAILSWELERCEDTHVAVYGTFFRRESGEYVINDVSRVVRVTVEDFGVCFEEPSSKQ